MRLATCPSCGGRASMQELADPPVRWAYCSDGCGQSGPYEEDASFAKWNTIAEMAAKARAGEAVYVYLRDQHTPEMSLARQFMEAALAEERAKAGLT